MLLGSFFSHPNQVGFVKNSDRLFEPQHETQGSQCDIFGIHGEKEVYPPSINFWI